MLNGDGVANPGEDPNKLLAGVLRRGPWNLAPAQ
jgi:hypothetical protein